ncbi:MAG TPA: LuxR C-terminal-related transcriptional regulator [Pseudonocardiaceae bacterium]
MTQHATTPRLILDAPTRRLLDAVEADPLAMTTVGIPAPGGYGKTTVLAELARVYRAAGIRVAGLADFGADESAVLLVDDAQQLGPAQLAELTALVAAGRTRAVIAYRPSPRSAPLAELADQLSRAGTQVSLAPWDADQIADYLADRLVAAPTAVAFTHANTGGVPRFVAHVGDALVEGAGWLDQQEPQLPRSAIDAMRPELDRLDQEVERFLLAVEAGVGRHVELLGALLGRSGDELADVMDAARATGLLGTDGALLPIARRAVSTLVPAERRIGIRQRLAEIQHERGGPVLDLARSLLGTGVGGTGVAAVFRAAAAEAMATRPALAAKLFAAAAAAGTPVTELAAGWARAAARSGDLDRALRLADQTIATDNAPDRAAAAEIAAAALAHRGQLGRSAELYRWAGPGFPASFATIGLLGTGQLSTGQGVPTPSSSDDGPPTLLAGAATLMAQGIQESITGSTTAALSQLVRASTLLEPAGQALLLPDSPAALAALVGVHGGELSLAESVLDRAAVANVGGPLLAARHRLLQAWIAMARGRMAAARENLIAATRMVRVLEPRDWLFAVALEVGLARRNSDLATLRRTWSQAGEAIMRHPVDLFTVLPLGEFAIAAARLRDQSRLRPHLDEAWALLGALGNPPLWSTQLHWSALHAAIIAEQPTVAAEHAAALTANAGHCGYCAVLAAAADSWLAVVAGNVDAPAVEATARALHEAGLCWDGARLAGQAAIRTSDRKAMVGLLNCARVLQGRPARPATARATTVTRPTNSAGAGSGTVTGGADVAGGTASAGRMNAAGPGNSTGRANSGAGANAPGAGISGPAYPQNPTGPTPPSRPTAASHRTNPTRPIATAPAAMAFSRPSAPPAMPATPTNRTLRAELDPGILSDREREVAALVVAGLTYKQVGDRLFISAKTVEHHVARMRQKLGATSRAELFDQLRQLVRPDPQS